MPAWSLTSAAAAEIGIVNPLPERVDAEWAFGGATGDGIKVCILDSGVEPSTRSSAVSPVRSRSRSARMASRSPRTTARATSAGTGRRARASSARSLPQSSSTPSRVLGAGFKGSGKVLLAGLRWAIEQGYDVINMSLSTTKRELGDHLHELTDTAYFRRTVLVAAAHNMPVESFPWRFSSVISVGSHEETDPFVYYANPDPPVEFFARGVDVEVAWLGGGTIRASGNSFATPCISGIASLILSKHPGLTPFQLKTVLHLTSQNVKESHA